MNIFKVFKSVLLLSIAICLLFLGGCTKSDPENAGKPQIALVMKSLANEFFKTMEEGAKAHHRDHVEEYDLQAIGIKDELDVAQQINHIELMIAQGVDAIVVAPVDSKALVPVCKQAMDAGIVVINIDNKFDDTVLVDKNMDVPFVGPDNRKGARLAGEYLATKLSKGDKVAIVEGAPNAFNGIQRKLGFEDAMKASGMNIVSSQTGYWETAKANQLVSALVTEHADLKAVLCANDSMALGAVAAIKASGMSDIQIIGFDNIEAIQKLRLSSEKVG
ncbi:substrate-binding domain-containing protein [Planctomycetota bacterium]